MAKILLIVAIIVSVATAGLGFLNKQKLAETLDILASTEASLDTTKKNLATSQEELANTQADLAKSNESLDKAEASLASTQADLDKSTADLAASKDELAKKESEVASLTTQVTDLQSKVDQFAAASQDTAAPVVETDDERLAELETLVSSLESKNQELNTELASLKQREADRAAVRMREGLEGRVLAVNPAYNFVVLSIGDRNGVVNNAELLLKRGGQYLGKVRVTSVEPSTSIADIVANSLPTGIAVQPGDSVIFQSSAN